MKKISIAESKLQQRLTQVVNENADLKVALVELLTAIEDAKTQQNKDAFWKVVERSTDTLYRIREKSNERN